MKQALSLVIAGIVIGLTTPAASSAAPPQGRPDAPAAVLSYTGCLNPGPNTLVQVAVGDIPANPPCRSGAIEVHFSGGDLTSLTAGTGLTGGGVNGDVSIALAPTFQLPQTCTPNQGTAWNGTGWACASFTSEVAFNSLVALLGSPGTINQGSNPVHWTKLKGVPAGFADGTDDIGPSYSAGFGLNLSGTTFSVDPAHVQRRVSETCVAGSAIRAVHEDGTVTCETVSSGGGARWSLTGNAGTDDTNYLGTSDDRPLNLKVNGQRALRLEPNSESPILVGGHVFNAVDPSASGATIAGGGSSSAPNSVAGDFATIGGGHGNLALGSSGTIAGGINNQAGAGWSAVGGGASNFATADGAAVSGGEQNEATGPGAFVGGGFSNRAEGQRAVVPGGSFNEAIGDWSFAAGASAHADHFGSFVWNGGGADTHSTGMQQFVVRAAGGLHLLDGELFCNGCVTTRDIDQKAMPGIAGYCGHARANPLSFPDAPCRTRSEAVDSTGSLDGATSLAVGTDGNPVISYLDGTNIDLKVARCNDPLCAGHNETLSTVDSTGLVGSDSSLAIGEDGNPVISYLNYGNQDLRVARCNDSGCTGGNETLSTVDPTAGRLGSVTSLAIGTDGNPVISYSDGTNDDLKVVHCNDPACTGGGEMLSIVDSGGDVGAFSSIAIGTDGNPVISYSDATNGDLKVAHCNDPACAGNNETLTAVDSAGIVGLETSLAIGTDGNPVISYIDFTSFSHYNLKVARCNDPACTGGDETLSIVDPNPTIVGDFSSIAIGTDGDPVISYVDSWVYRLMFVHCNDPACTDGDETLQHIALGNISDGYTSLAIGTDGNPVISYHDVESDDLSVARPSIPN
jgi:hypothetical protein